MILTPAEYVGGILQLCQDKRGVQKALEYKASNRVLITYELPFNEVVLDFYDRLKTISRGYASLDYHVTGYWASPLVKLDILVNGEPVDALSMIVHRDRAYERGRPLVAKMRELIPRQMFEVAIQAAIGARIIARESVKAMRKNVLAKCYGGDISRKRKLLEKQKEGKKRMKRVGSVDIPQEAFLAVLKLQGRLDRDAGGLPEVDRPRVLRVDRRRGDPGAVHPHLRRAGLQDPDRLDGAEPARRRSPAREQVRLRADGHRALERALLPMRPIVRGDVVVFKFPEEPERDFIKRIIGLPGETIEVRGTQVLVNGTAIASRTPTSCCRTTRRRRVNEGDPRERYGPVTVPAGHYFTMGDNRDNSQDSRYWGFLPGHYVKGRALMIYWSFDTPESPDAGRLIGGTRWSRLLHQIH